MHTYVYEQCADLVFDEMQRIAAQCESTELSRFPALKERVVEVVHGKYIAQYTLKSYWTRSYMSHICVILVYRSYK
jgi:Dynamin central region